ncbi:pyrimidine operon attenuation protein / uracil phosphoribosyltransferase [Dyadobacter koreensis]|uniref:Pyrimidine operon attenuation protein / uracil phosphoribosyltransferase n=1 Tax=Dyadobacter koreensis TaxID=408657 RepID=A0A1H6ZL46_9BACT|nr:phosphoribosyltransferase family protein [Dyadobacter koreensis]SEJ49545.1 pyrimidine operon attenuation protein / uracil phosphoribosyltransferase [Dyadobacter koreensis]
MMDNSITTHRQILTSLQTRQKIRRIAFEIYEQNFEEKEIILAGIVGEGYEFAKVLSQELKSISPLDVKLIELRFDKTINQQSEIHFDDDTVQVENQVVVVVDDVLNTGRTLAFALEPFLKVQMKKVQVAVIVDREHHKFPISADYVGYSLSTTISERVEVILSRSSDEGVYLK